MGRSTTIVSNFKTTTADPFGEIIGVTLFGNDDSSVSHLLLPCCNLNKPKPACGVGSRKGRIAPKFGRNKTVYVCLKCREKLENAR